MASKETYLGDVQDVNGTTVSITLSKNSLTGFVYIDGQGIGRLTLGTDNGKILFYDEAAGNPNLIDSFKVDSTNIIKQITANGDYFAFITESKIASIPPTPFVLFYDSQGYTFSFTAERTSWRRRQHPIRLGPA